METTKPTKQKRWIDGIHQARGRVKQKGKANMSATGKECNDRNKTVLSDNKLQCKWS